MAERATEEARPLHVTLLMYETAASRPETLEVDVEVSDSATVAELKIILETSDLIPPSDEQEPSHIEPMQVCVRLNEESAVLDDEDCITRDQTQVQVLVLPKHAPIPQPAIRAARRRLPPVMTPAHVEDLPFLPPPPVGGMQALLSTPLVRSLLGNPDVLRSLLDANPQMRELRERNPELNSLFNDPDLFRQSVEAMQNPSLLREMVSNTDRALNNIDAIPGGFNALRRVYHDIQSPLWDATSGMSVPLAERRHYTIDSSSSPSCAPVPNPFAPNRKSAAVDQQPPCPRPNKTSSKRRKPMTSNSPQAHTPEPSTCTARPAATSSSSPLSVPSAAVPVAPRSEDIHRAIYYTLLPGASLVQRPPSQSDEPGGSGNAKDTKTSHQGDFLNEEKDSPK